MKLESIFKDKLYRNYLRWWKKIFNWNEEHIQNVYFLGLNLWFDSVFILMKNDDVNGRRKNVKKNK